MKALVTEKTKSNSINNFKSFFVEPVSNGLFGFALFFSILLLTKGLASFLNIQKSFVVDFDDVILSSIGFILLFLIKLLENIGRVRNN